ncbi:probable inactive receptor kinase At2g26730 [Olea europaea subsp. europaea]|uniref:Probable inactive receptor kinase At2g26730 n=1 Tax=Olea europaea subsp. europaea TaxID=158383 RepID=A0A8S0VD63_OLEEU|nr:probable inactive receptor kinase At2g26730 [Olea europaea subsp. europaea]
MASLFEFLNLEELNVSNNNLSGSIPDVQGQFNASSFLGNLELCGKPLPSNCPPPQPPAEKKGSSIKMYLMYLGYALIALVLVSLIALKVIQRNKLKDKKEIAKKGLRTMPRKIRLVAARLVSRKEETYLSTR